MLSKERNEQKSKKERKTYFTTFNNNTMKTQNTNFLQPLGKTQLDNLVKEVKETVATNVPVINPRPAFTAADLWNLERNRRNRATRRHLAF